MSDSIWKKEISLRRKAPAAPAPEPVVAAEPKQSVWKREISLGRKAAPVAPAPVVAAEPKQSVWKKEISLGRKAAPVAPAPVVAAGPKQSIWKKEISLSGKRRRRQVEHPAQAAAQPASPEFASEPALDLMEALVQHGALPQYPTVAETFASAGPSPGEPAPVAPADPGVPTAGTAPVAAVPVVSEPAVELPPVSEAPPVEPSPPFSPPLSPLSAEVVAATAPPEPGPLPELDLEPEPAAALEPVARQPEPWGAAPVVPPAPPEPDAPSVLEPEKAAWESSRWEAVEPEPVVAPAPAFEPEPDVAPEPVLAFELPVEPESVVAAEPLVAPALSLEPEPAVAPAPEPVPEPELAVEPEPEAPLPPARVSFWKAERSLTGRRRKTAASAPRRLSLRRASRPGRGGGHHASTRVVGLKIGSSQLAAARISNNGVAELHQVVRQELPPGIVVSGEVRDPDALATALRRFFAANKLPRKGVRLGVASNRIGVRTVEVVGIESERQLENAIRFRAQEVLPIPSEEAVLDYQVLATSVDGEGRSVKRILLVVAHRDLVERYVGACKRAGVVLAGVDLEAFALLRSLAPPAEPGDSALVAVAIGHDRSTLAVSNGRVCEFTRVLEWGGASLDVALARALDRAPSEVEAIKHGLSLDGRGAPVGLAVAEVDVALDAVRRELRSFARELVASLQFYQAQPGSLGIGDIVITGGTTQLPGLAAELAQLVGVAVRVGNPLARLKVSSRLEHTEQVGSLAVAIGLGIDD